MYVTSNEWDNASKEWIEALQINQVRTNILIPETLKILQAQKKDKQGETLYENLHKC